MRDRKSRHFTLFILLAFIEFTLNISNFYRLGVCFFYWLVGLLVFRDRNCRFWSLSVLASIGSDEVFVLSDSEDENANSVGGAVGSIPLVRGQAQRDLAMPDPSHVVRYGAVQGPILTRAEEEALRSGQYYCPDVSGEGNNGNVRCVECVNV